MRFLVLLLACTVTVAPTCPDIQPTIAYEDLQCHTITAPGGPVGPNHFGGIPTRWFLTRAPQMNECELFQLSHDCVDRINEFRDGTRKFSNGQTSPYVPCGKLEYLDPWTKCVAQETIGEVRQNVRGWINGNPNIEGTYSRSMCCAGLEWDDYMVDLFPHGDGWGAPDMASTTQYYLNYAQSKARMYADIQAAWDEGSTWDRYEHLAWSGYKYATCTFAWTNAGMMVGTVRLHTAASAPYISLCNCTGKAAGADAGCTTNAPTMPPVLCVNPSPPTPAPIAPPTNAPTTSTPTTKAPTKYPTAPTTKAPTLCPLITMEQARMVCISGYILDCMGVCWYPDTYIYASIRNGICNDYKVEAGVELNCTRYCCDGGDCGTSCNGP